MRRAGTLLVACIGAAVVALLVLGLGSPSPRSLGFGKEVLGLGSPSSRSLGFGKETSYCREQRKVCEDKCKGGKVDFKVSHCPRRSSHLFILATYLLSFLPFPSPQCSDKGPGSRAVACSCVSGEGGGYTTRALF